MIGGFVASPVEGVGRGSEEPRIGFHVLVHRTGVSPNPPFFCMHRPIRLIRVG